MQSTLNTAVLPLRPKIGRPPLEVILPSPPPVKTWEFPFAWKPRVATFTLALAVAAALVLSHVITPAAQELNQEPLALVAKPAGGPQPIVGALTPLQPAEPAVSYTAQTRQPVIDNAARQRLLSILSKD